MFSLFASARSAAVSINGGIGIIITSMPMIPLSPLVATLRGHTFTNLSNTLEGSKDTADGSWATPLAWPKWDAKMASRCNDNMFVVQAKFLIASSAGQKCPAGFGVKTGW
eukprot:9055242-Ditylum_brightwellii.AAC.1